MIIIKCPKCKAKHKLSKKDILKRSSLATTIRCKQCAYIIKIKIN